MFDILSLLLIIAIIVATLLFISCLVSFAVINDKLKAGREKLDSGWSKYYAGQSKYNAGEREYNKYKRIYDIGKFISPFPVLLFGGKLKDGERQLRDGKKELTDGIKKLKDGEAQYSNGLIVRKRVIIATEIFAIVDIALVIAFFAIY